MNASARKCEGCVCVPVCVFAARMGYTRNWAPVIEHTIIKAGAICVHTCQ